MNKIKIPCIILNPKKNKKFVNINVDIIGIFTTFIISVNVPLKRYSNDLESDILFSFGRLSGSIVIANKNEIEDKRLERRQGKR